MILEIDNGSLYYESSEDINVTTKPILFVLPGGPGADHTIYKTHSAELEEFCCVIYHDPRGCGKSNNFHPATATMENYIDDVESLRRHLNINQIFLLGTSYGSMCAMGYATKYSKNLQKLILISGSPSYRFLDTAKRNLDRYGTAEQKEISQCLWNGSFKDQEHVANFMRIMKPLYSKNPSYLNSASSSQNYTFSTDVLNLGFGGFMHTFDFLPNLNQILCPTLMLVGKDDWINDPIHLQEAASCIRNSQLEIIENCGHFVAIDQHETYLNFIRKFILN